MSIFENFPRKEKLVVKSYEIDVSLYEKLEHISNDLYDIHISKLVNICIEQLLISQKIIPYQRPKNEISVNRSFGIRESLYKGLTKLKREYGLSYNRLINIAIYNVLVDEGIIKIKKK